MIGGGVAKSHTGEFERGGGAVGGEGKVIMLKGDQGRVESCGIRRSDELVKPCAITNNLD